MKITAARTSSNLTDAPVHHWAPGESSATGVCLHVSVKYSFLWELEGDFRCVVLFFVFFWQQLNKRQRLMKQKVLSDDKKIKKSPFRLETTNSSPCTTNEVPKKTPRGNVCCPSSPQASTHLCPSYAFSFPFFLSPSLSFCSSLLCLVNLPAPSTPSSSDPGLLLLPAHSNFGSSAWQPAREQLNHRELKPSTDVNEDKRGRGFVLFLKVNTPRSHQQLGGAQ